MKKDFLKSQKNNDEPLDLLAIQGAFFKVFEGIEENIPQVSLPPAQQEYVDDYAEIIKYVESMFEKYKTAKWREIWNDEKGDWERNKDGEIILHECTDEEKKIIESHKKKAIGILTAKVKSILLTWRNQDRNHALNVTSNYVNTKEGMINQKEEVSKSIAQKIKSKFRGGEEEEDD